MCSESFENSEDSDLLQNNNNYKTAHKFGKHETLDSKAVQRRRILAQCLVTAAVMLSSASCGMPVGYSAILLPQLQITNDSMRIGDEMGSWIASLHSAATPVGSLLSGIFMDRFGRKVAMQIASTPLIVGWLLIGLAQNHVWLLIGRIVAGISAGLAAATGQKRPTLDRMFASTSQRNDDGLRASYNISLLIAKSGKPHTIGEKLILPAVEEVLKTVLHKPASDIIKRIPLSNNTVERCIDEMSSDIESFLCNYLQTTHFSRQLDESTLPDNAALLLAYVRFIMNQEIYEELLFARTLITDTKGESIFYVLKDYFLEKAIPLSNIISVATDRAPAMVGRYRGFISYLKQNVSGVLAIHCAIHRQHLVAKNLSVRLHESLHLVIDTVNRIRSNALNTRLFAQLCEENDEHFHQLLLRTEVRWLSKGFCLTRFFALFETILEFLDNKDKILKENLMKRKTDIAYLTDLFTKFNMVNLQLQGDSLNLIKTKSILSAFLVRVKLMKQNIGRGEFSQFPNLSQTSCQEDDVSNYLQHLNALYSDFESRFEDILTMVFIGEISEPHLRGIFSSGPFASYSFGILLVYALGFLLPWREVAGLSAIPPITALAIYFFLPESPVWLVRRGRIEEARASMLWLRGGNLNKVRTSFQKTGTTIILRRLPLYF
ncbi:unnamed protein product [Acanthoscelides obtectus]|uniref:Uncharacterized protein n=1 Tax=Acanthoscelides obtectus TaxID=200917 RepID=A0A9P0Q873_ACAOB|nr:unnamed protein product [Acanthoscelides obtectus]CAK1626643.1 Protein ZBED8 [Acanthoscelides obtectus]